MGFAAAILKAKQQGLSLAQELNDYKKDLEPKVDDSNDVGHENAIAVSEFSSVNGSADLIKFLLNHKTWKGSINAGAIDSDYMITFSSIDNNGDFKGSSTAFLQTGMEKVNFLFLYFYRTNQGNY